MFSWEIHKLVHVWENQIKICKIPRNFALTKKVTLESNYTSHEKYDMKLCVCVGVCWWEVETLMSSDLQQASIRIMSWSIR